MEPDQAEKDAETQTGGLPDALQKRLESLYERKAVDVIAPYIQPELFHYTTVEGLRGIIQSNVLHASSAYHLNDSSEIEYGSQLVVDATGKWLQVNSGKQSLGLRMLQVINATFTSEPSRIGRYVGIYVVCFCENGNLLSQWRAYGQTGGYSIGMLSSALELDLLAPGFFNTRLIKVIYDPQEQEQIIHSLITAYLEEVENRDLYTMPADPQQRTRFLSHLGLFLQELLLEQVVRFKNPAFAEEREWRIVARPRLIDILRFKKEQRSSEKEDRSQIDVGYRTSRGVLVPFLKLSPGNGESLPIRSVRFGPSLDKMRTENSLSSFLFQHGHQNVRVLGSDMPVLL